MRESGRIKAWLQESGIPEDAVSDRARVTLTGRSAVSIEGQHGVVELTQERIRLKTGGGILIVTGSGLALRTLSPELAVIMGEPIDGVSYR